MNLLRLKLVNITLDNIIAKKNDKQLVDELYSVEKEMLLKHKPNSWNVHDENNLEKSMEVDFRMFVISVSEHLKIDVLSMTAFDFYAAVEYLNSKNKK